MSKFCSNCGKEKVKCICPSEKVETAIVSANEFNFEKEVNMFFEKIKSIFKKPITETDKIVNDTNNVKFGIELLSVYAIALVGFVCLLIKEGSKLFGSLMALLAMSSPDASLEYMDLASVTDSIPYFKISLYIIVFLAAVVAISGLSIYLINNFVYKQKLDYKKIAIFLGIINLPMTVALVVSILLIYILPGAVIYLILLGMILSSILFILNLNSLFDLPKDKVPYAIIYTYILNAILAYFVIIKMLPEILFL